MSALQHLPSLLASSLRHGLKAVGAVLVLWIIYSVTQGIYNVLFHPLAKFPGPKLAAASSFPYVQASIQGRHPHWVLQLHKEYSSNVVRVSPRELSFIDAKAWVDIMGSRAGHVRFEKDLVVYGKPPNKVDSLLTANREDHSRMRRVIDYAFSTKAYKEQEPIVQLYVDQLINCLRDQIKTPSGGRVDLVKWYNWMSFDIIGDLAFGESFDCLKTQKYHPWVEMIFGNLKGFVFANSFNRFPVFHYLLPYLIPKHLKEMLDDHWAYTTEKISHRMKLGTNRSDFMSFILTNNVEGKALSQAEMQSNASLFVIAGSESVATTLSGATYFLLKNPKTLKKLTDEILNAFTSEAEINSKTVAQLPYLLAVLNETYRIYPTALTGQACCVPPEGDTICGYWVPGNTGVSINQYVANHSPTNFFLPDAFIPDRWLDPSSPSFDTRFTSDNHDVFHPFSFGPRNCIGKILGDAETRIVLAKMLWNFELELCEDETVDWADQQAFLSWQKKPLMVRLRSRERAMAASS